MAYMARVVLLVQDLELVVHIYILYIVVFVFLLRYQQVHLPNNLLDP